VIYRIYRLLDHQQQKLLRFLLSDSPRPGECSLPILPSKHNQQRVDPEEPIADTGIYRDPWERRVRPLSEGDARVNGVVDTFNYNSFEDWVDANKRGREARQKRRERERQGVE
jgi:hypothetical protein